LLKIVTRLREACHGWKEGSRRTLGCYEIVTRLKTGAARFSIKKDFLFKQKPVPEVGVTIFGDLKCDFET